MAHVRHTTPTTTRPWHAIEKTDHGIAIVRAAKGDVKLFRPTNFTYSDYIERMLNKMKIEGWKNAMGHDRITQFFPNRTELFHEHFRPHIVYSYRYSAGTKKTPEIVIEPLINIPGEERAKAVEQLRQIGSIKIGELVGHKVHVFEQHNQPEAEKLARKMSRFFRHDVQIVQHYNEPPQRA